MGSSCLDLGYCMCLNNEYTWASGGCLGASVRCMGECGRCIMTMGTDRG